MSEATDHQALAEFLRYHAIPRLPDLAYCWHTANESAGGPKTDTGIPLDVLREARMGAVAGVWDWLLIGTNKSSLGEVRPFTFNGLAIELKSIRAYRSANQGLTQEQLAWRERYKDCFWYTAVFCEWTDAARLLIRWVGGDVTDFRF